MAVRHATEALLVKQNELYCRQGGKQRAKRFGLKAKVVMDNVKAKGESDYSVPKELRNRACRAVFGDWTDTYEDGKLETADCPPGQKSEITNYSVQVE